MNLQHTSAVLSKDTPFSIGNLYQQLNYFCPSTPRTDALISFISTSDILIENLILLAFWLPVRFFVHMYPNITSFHSFPLHLIQKWEDIYKCTKF